MTTNLLTNIKNKNLAMCLYQSTEWFGDSYDEQSGIFFVHKTKFIIVFRLICLLVASLLICSTFSVFAKASFVGSNTCAYCHQEQFQQWQDSHHDLAMQEATVDTVLGNFENQTFTYFDVTSTFFKKGNKFFIKTDGPDGELTEFEIKYTFGVYPLQQYLIEFADGRMQSLGIVWDTRANEKGGQRWFHLYPDEQIIHGDPLHWTGIDQNWNYMCAECHSTNLKKNFNQEQNIFETTWAEIDVACEACHGPGKEHVAWAQQVKGKQKSINKDLQVTLNNSTTWIINPKTGLASRSSPRTSHIEIETCARCHARRSMQWDEYVHGRPLLDTHVPARLSDTLYFSDGQINDEVYVYGSFLQSKMYQKGVTCSDCHNPHTLKLKAEGNQLCNSCHLATKFDTPTHHFHKTEGEGTKCTSCHMPKKNYMVIDARGDHSFRIPRPDLSLKLDVPNACTQCHQNENNEWAAAAIETWYPNSKRREDIHYGEVLVAGRKGTIDANQLLIDLASNATNLAIVRATATSLLQGYLNPNTLTALNDLLHDEEAIVRFSSITAVESLPPQVKVKLLKHLLKDDLRMLRIEAARALADSNEHITNEDIKAQFDQALDEYITAQHTNAERPEAHTNLGTLHANMQRVDSAQREFEQAITIDTSYIPAYINLADLYRARGLDGQGKRYLETAIEKRPDSGSVHHALGLLYVRQKKLPEALSSLKKAVELAPQNTRYKYVYAVALDSTGGPSKAINVLKQAHEQRTADRDVLYALISYHQKAGNIKKARDYAEVLIEVSPWDQNAKALLERL